MPAAQIHAKPISAKPINAIPIAASGYMPGAAINAMKP